MRYVRLFVVLTLTVSLFGAAFSSITKTVNPLGVGDYNPWYDINDDGKVDIKDISSVAKAFGKTGQNITKGSLQFDSGWLDLTGQTSQTYMIIHNLNTPSTNMIVDARQKRLENMTYGGTETDRAYDLVRTFDGGYALAGSTNSTGAGGADFWLVKTDASGNAQWNKTYGGTHDDVAYALLQTIDGGYALAGYTESDVGCDFWLVKTDGGGGELWNKTYGRTLDEQAFALVRTLDGGYAMAGYSKSFAADPRYEDCWLVKTDGNGNEQWNQTYGGIYPDVAYSLIQTADGGYAMAGYTMSYGWHGDAYVVKTHANGVMDWNQRYGGYSEDWTYALIQTSDGGYAVAGSTWSFGMGQDDFYLFKTGSDGNMLWNKTYGFMGVDVARDLVQTGDGGYLLAGHSRSYGVGEKGAWLVKTDSDGDAQWNESYGGIYDDFAHALIKTDEGGYAFAGYTLSFGAGNADMWLVKVNSNGEIVLKESGLVWEYSSPSMILLYKRTTDPDWRYVRVQIWKKR